jgi:hypothetical protein
LLGSTGAIRAYYRDARWRYSMGRRGACLRPHPPSYGIPRLCLVVTDRGKRYAAVLRGATSGANQVAGRRSASGNRGGEKVVVTMREYKCNACGATIWEDHFRGMSNFCFYCGSRWKLIQIDRLRGNQMFLVPRPGPGFSARQDAGFVDRLFLIGGVAPVLRFFYRMTHPGRFQEYSLRAQMVRFFYRLRHWDDEDSN